MEPTPAPYPTPPAPGASQALLQAILDAPNIGVAVYRAVRDAAGAVVDFACEYGNRASGALLGTDEAGRLLSDHDDPGAPQLPRFCQVLATGQPGAYVQPGRGPGPPRWLAVTNTLLDGDRLVHTREDITERQRAAADTLRLQAETAQQVADKYQTLFNSIDEGYALIELLYDEHGQVTDFLHLEVNPMAERINGFPNMAGRRIRELMPDVETYWLELYGRVVANGEPARAEHYVAAQRRWFSVYASRVGGPGSPRIAAVFDDITARKQAEARQALLVAIVDDLQHLTSPHELLQLVGARLGEHLRLATCSFVDVDEARDAVHVQASWHRAGVADRQHHTFRLGDFMTADLRQASRAGKTVAVSDTATDARVHPDAHARLGVGAWVAVPYHRAGRWRGFLTATATAPHTWQADEIELVQDVAARVFPRIERARTEAALRASEEKYRTLFDAMDEGYCIIQMLYDAAGQAVDWRYQEVNPAFAKHNGLANARGKTIRELKPDIEPKWVAAYGHVAATGESRRFKETSDALQRSFDLYAFRVGEPGAGLVAVLFTDITERQRRAQQQDYLLQLSDALRELTSPTDIQATATALLRQHLALDQARYAEAGEAGKGSPELPALLRSRPWACSDVATDPGLSAGQRAAYRAQGIGAAVAVPLFQHGRLAATLVASQRTPRAWAAAEVALVAETAERTWAAAERARTEAALAASEQRLRALITNLPGAAAFVVGPDLRLQLAGGEALDAAGIGPASLLGRTVAEAVPPHLAPKYEALYRQGLAGQGFSLEHTARGSTFISRGVPLPGPAGQPEAVLVVSYDITARKQAEEALRASEAQLAEFNARLEQRVARRTQQLQASRDLLQSVFDASFISLSVLNAVRDEAGQVQDFRLALVNKELERETGRTDLVGKLYSQEYPGIRQVGIYDLLLQTLATGKPQGMEYFYDHEGFNRWFTCQFVKLGDGVVATNLDITERKTAEQERTRNLRLLEQAEAVAGLGSWDYDLASRTLRWSDGMYHLFGRSPGSPVEPATYLRQVVASDRAQAERLVQRLGSGAGSFEETLRLRVGAQVKTLRIKAVVQRNEANQPVRVLGVALDLSELQRLEADNLRLRLGQQQALFEAVQAAQETERARMAESLHNGIGQILYATKLRLDRLHAPLLGTDPALTAARREADELLSEAMRQTRALSHELVPTTLKEFGLAAALQDISHKLSMPPLRVRSQVLLDDEAGPLAPALQMALYRMAQELAQNIAKHARGATKASLELETMPGWVLLRAEDNGAGFAPAPADSPGLGLRSIRDRVALLGGQLQVGSAPTGGAYVRIRIPLLSPPPYDTPLPRR
jgi:PAS domain S-box-containing protein